MVPGDPGHPVYLKTKQNLTRCWLFLFVGFSQWKPLPVPFVTLHARAMVGYVVCIHWRG